MAKKAPKSAPKENEDEEPESVIEEEDLETELEEEEPEPLPKKEEPKPAPKKEEPKPAPKKEEPKPAPKKEEPKPAPKKEEPKPETTEKPKKKSEGLKKFEDSIVKIGYIDVYDFLTLIVGLWGLVWTIILFIVFLGSDAANLSMPILSAPSNDAWLALGIFIIAFWIYINLAFFPFMIKKLGMKAIAWKSFPLHFIKSGEDFRAFNVFLGFWSCVLFWISFWGMRWPHFISVVILTIIILADPMSKKFKKMPEKRVQEYKQN